MTTLDKATTAALLARGDYGYAQLISHWSALVNDPQTRRNLSCAHHLIYQILRGKNWQRSITAITNRKKLENGAFYAWRGRKAIYRIFDDSDEAWLIAPFADLLAPCALDQIRERLARPAWRRSPLESEPYID